MSLKGHLLSPGSYFRGSYLKTKTLPTGVVNCYRNRRGATMVIKHISFQPHSLALSFNAH